LKPKATEIVETLKERTTRIKGDYLLIKDVNGNIYQLILGSCNPDDGSCEYTIGFWSGSIPSNTAIIELYAYSIDNSYGLVIDKYVRGLTESERTIAEEETLEEYYKDCEDRGIPREECPIPK